MQAVALEMVFSVEALLVAFVIWYCF
jgi:hypothetical protein